MVLERNLRRPIHCRDDGVLTKLSVELKIISDLVESSAYGLAGELQASSVTELFLISARLAEISKTLVHDAEPPSDSELAKDFDDLDSLREV